MTNPPLPRAVLLYAILLLVAPSTLLLSSTSVSAATTVHGVVTTEGFVKEPRVDPSGSGSGSGRVVGGASTPHFPPLVPARHMKRRQRGLVKCSPGMNMNMMMSAYTVPSYLSYDILLSVFLLFACPTHTTTNASFPPSLFLSAEGSSAPVRPPTNEFPALGTQSPTAPPTLPLPPMTGGMMGGGKGKGMHPDQDDDDEFAGVGTMNPTTAPTHYPHIGKGSGGGKGSSGGGSNPVVDDDNDWTGSMGTQAPTGPTLSPSRPPTPIEDLPVHDDMGSGGGGGGGGASLPTIAPTSRNGGKGSGGGGSGVVPNDDEIDANSNNTAPTAEPTYVLGVEGETIEPSPANMIPPSPSPTMTELPTFGPTTTKVPSMEPTTTRVPTFSPANSAAPSDNTIVGESTSSLSTGAAVGMAMAGAAVIVVGVAVAKLRRGPHSYYGHTNMETSVMTPEVNDTMMAAPLHPDDPAYATGFEVTPAGTVGGMVGPIHEPRDLEHTPPPSNATKHMPPPWRSEPRDDDGTPAMPSFEDGV